MKAVAASKEVRLASASPCSGEAPRSSSARYPQVFCPTPVSEAQERVRALTKVCQAFQRLMAGVRRRCSRDGLTKALARGAGAAANTSRPMPLINGSARHVVNGMNYSSCLAAI
jgi:hypothetical protein